MSTSAKTANSLAGMPRWIAWLSWANLAALLILSLLLFAVSERWWLSSALTFAPRLPWLVPALALLFGSCVWHRASAPVNFIAVTMVAVPIMGLTLPVSHWLASSSTDATGPTLKIVSCNIQDFRPDFAAVLAEINRFNPDVVLFQDCRNQSKLLDQNFESWNVVRDGEFFLASRYPARFVAAGFFEAFHRDAVIQCELQLPTTRVMVYNIHHMTPRHGLRALDLSSPITQRGSEKMSRHLELRVEEAADVRAFVDRNRGDIPTLIAGDFNMPCESSLYQRNWTDFQNAFNTVGTGYGYSFPCTRQYCWPAGLPWMRLDHVLADPAWQVRQCVVGKANGSDHRPIFATLTLR